MQAMGIDQIISANSRFGVEDGCSPTHFLSLTSPLQMPTLSWLVFKPSTYAAKKRFSTEASTPSSMAASVLLVWKAQAACQR